MEDPYMFYGNVAYDTGEDDELGIGPSLCPRIQPDPAEVVQPSLVQDKGGYQMTDEEFESLLVERIAEQEESKTSPPAKKTLQVTDEMLREFLQMAQKSLKPGSLEREEIGKKKKEFAAFQAERAAKKQRKSEEGVTGPYGSMKKPTPAEVHATEFGRVVKDIELSLEKEVFFHSPEFNHIIERVKGKYPSVDTELLKLIRSISTIVTYEVDGNECTRPLYYKPDSVSEPDCYVNFELRDCQKKTVLKLLKLLFRHSAVINAPEMGYGKTYITVTLANILVELKVINTVVLLMPGQLVSNWVDTIAKLGEGGPAHEVFHVTKDNLKDRRLPFQIMSSKSVRKYVLFNSSCMNNPDNMEYLFGFQNAFGEYALVHDEFQDVNRNSTVPKSTREFSFAMKKYQILVSATAIMSGKKDEVCNVLGLSRALVDTRLHTALARKFALGDLTEPREKHLQLVLPRNFSPEQNMEILKRLSVVAEPGWADSQKIMPAAIYEVCVASSIDAKGKEVPPRRELHGNNVPFEVNQRLLALFRMACLAHQILGAMAVGGQRARVGSVLVVVENIEALKAMEEELRRLGFQAVAVHGGVPSEARYKNIKRLETEPGLIGLGTKGICCVGLNLQKYVEVMLLSSQSYVTQEDLQTAARIRRPGQTYNPLIIYATHQKKTDERVAMLALDKTMKTKPYYPVNPGTGQPVDIRAMHGVLTDAAIVPMLWGMMAAKDAGHTLNGRCFAPHHLTDLKPPAEQEEWDALMGLLTTTQISCPIKGLPAPGDPVPVPVPVTAAADGDSDQED